jgi:outer membrane protein assembly factor BamA
VQVAIVPAQDDKARAPAAPSRMTSSGFIAVLLFLASCSSTKNIPEGDRLYTGAYFKWENGNKKNVNELDEGLENHIRPKPNKKILGMPVKLWIYNMANPKKDKGINKLLKRAGEPPVLFSNVRPQYTSKVLQSYLEDNGFFQADVSPEVKNKGKKKASVNYNITPDIRYVIRKVQYETDSSTLGKDIKTAARGTLLKTGDYFNLDIIKAERDRIHDRLRQKGYYYFNEDYLIVEVDSTNKGSVDLFVKVKPETPFMARQIYRIKNVTIYTNYSLEDSSQIHQPAVQYKDLKIVDPDKLYRPSVFDHVIFIRPDSLYRVRAHNITLQRLVDLGTFKYVRGQFRNSRSDSGMLNASFYLTPYPKRSLQFQVTGTSKSNNFVGSEVQITARNRNWLKAANQLDIKLGAGFETQVGGGKQRLSSTAGYSLSAGISLTIPRFFFPPFEYKLNSPTIPKTRFSLDYQLLTRRNLYNLNGFQFDLSYIWKPRRFVQHTLSPISVSLVLPSGFTPLFDSLLNLDPALRQSLQKQFILGTNYDINFNNQTARRIHTYYLNGNIDVSGNLTGLIIPKKDSTKDLFGTPFAQYIRFTAEARHYWKLNRSGKSSWASRALLGYSIPYGNSITLPFVKQYFIGGSNSVRAFRARTLGPGTFRDTLSALFANQAGDIKLELNTELRAQLFGIVNGAIFVDAGNIWLKADSTATGRTGSQFRLSNIFKELAVGTGVGLRIDASILIVRFDLAFPLRKPWLPEGRQWVINQIDFGSSQWRRDNLILNIAIGYPF